MALCGTSGSHTEKTLEFTDFYHKASEILGMGSYSVVKIFTEKSSGKEYAVKIVKKSFLKPDEVWSLDEESNILSRIHRNIVGFRESFAKPKLYYLVMELLTGGCLYQYVTSDNRSSDCEENVVRSTCATYSTDYGTATR